ncbi:hypothetical protein dsx2_0642 [Desulfovibrio sp. X2]|uniref:PD-(D/E)XK nuclease family protein n=1 Tax=Desulfovibrio sp. X2 TaxID=941449 RepID=UPI000358C78E|nr:PD-(D/E)XK nuclease family protein [Desulfovibrio sp. X2]EPR37710.1 hypothetical protein dsx2_0642 [Desulfovibrio sp. X2]
MNHCVFSSYRQKENFITSSLMSVLGNLSLIQINNFFSLLLEDDDDTIFSIKNQHTHINDDARISFDATITMKYDIFLETKVDRNVDASDQLNNYISRLSEENCSPRKNTNAIIIYLTPDANCPPWFFRIKSGDISMKWISFDMIYKTINTIIDGTQDENQMDILSEREIFLLRQFQMLIQNENLLTSNEMNVLIIPAGTAWNKYIRLDTDGYSAYICQENRWFRDGIEHLAFYKNGAVLQSVPKIIAAMDSVSIEDTEDSFSKFNEHSKIDDVEIARKLFKKIFESEPSDPTDHRRKILILEGKHKCYVQLDGPIINDTKSASGRNTAFVQRQRYTSLEKIIKAKKTSEL